jgi:hypothetical protein
MPIPFMDNDHFKRRCISSTIKFSVWPRTCFYSKKSLWLTHAYRLTAMITGPGEPVFEDRWVDRKEYIFLKIKGVV